jgi:glycine betaine/proline transport system substrate-binding protein
MRSFANTHFLKLCIAAISLCTSANSFADRALPGLGIKTQAIQSPIKEETFQTLIIDEALKQLGYEVQPIKQLEYRQGYDAIANGEATYSTTNWYPLQDKMYEGAGGNKVFYRKGHLIKGAAQGYLIDKKTAEKYQIDNISDLKDPEVAKLFDMNGDDKADLVGCQKGWSCADVINHQLEKYGLTDAIDHIQGQYADLIPATIKRFKQGLPVVYYTWTPYWVSGSLVPTKDVIWLEVPYSAHPNNINTTLVNGKNYGFKINSERIIANKKFAKDNPAAAKLFAVAAIPINDVSAENSLVAQGEDTPADIDSHAQQWIKDNQSLFNKWLERALKAAK